MKSKQILTIVVMLIVGFAIGYYIAQSKLSNTNQIGAAITYDKNAKPTAEQQKVITALNQISYKSSVEALSGTSLQKSLSSIGVGGTGSNDILVAWCIGNSYWVSYWNVWYYWGVNGWTTWPGAQPNGPCLYYQVDPNV